MKPIYLAIFILICAVAGGVGSYFLHISFWAGFGLAAGSLLLNSFIAEWEDRKRKKAK